MRYAPIVAILFAWIFFKSYEETRKRVEFENKNIILEGKLIKCEKHIENLHESMGDMYGE